MQKTLKQMLIGAGLVVGLTTTAQAQFLTDAGSPLGGGGGASGSVANYMSNLGASRAGLSSWLRATSVPNPAAGGAMVNANSAAQTAFWTAITGGGTAGLVSALGGSPQAQAFANAAGAVGNSFANVTPQLALQLVDAYNALVDVPSASVEALATVRAGVAALLQLRQ